MFFLAVVMLEPTTSNAHRNTSSGLWSATLLQLCVFGKRCPYFSPNSAAVQMMGLLMAAAAAARSSSPWRDLYNSLSLRFATSVLYFDASSYAFISVVADFILLPREFYAYFDVAKLILYFDLCKYIYTKC